MGSHNTYEIVHFKTMFHESRLKNPCPNKGFINSYTNDITIDWTRMVIFIKGESRTQKLTSDTDEVGGLSDRRLL